MNNSELRVKLQEAKNRLGEGKGVTQEEIAMLDSIMTGKGLVNYMGFLLHLIKNGVNEEAKQSAVKQSEEIFPMYEQWYDEQVEENKKLKEENAKLNDRLDRIQLLVNTFNKCHLQQAKLQSGEKIAYKGHASIERILELMGEGKKHEEIAEILGISRATIWRRLKEHNEKQGGV